jgi:cytochrome c553
MKRLPLLTSLFVWLLCTSVLTAGPQRQLDSKSAARKAVSSSNSKGEKRFRTNCGRCHNPPENLSPREVRAVIRHMRVRAMLSAEDEKEIVAYLAP